MARRRGAKAWNYHLRVLRWRKLLENAARLMHLFDDASEKVRGEYIFDLHYVHSLPEDILDGLGEMLLDARVLEAEGLDAVADGQARARQAAEALKRAPADTPPAEADDPLDFPEYRLLTRFIDSWIAGSADDGPSQRDRFWQIVERAAEAFVQTDLPWQPDQPLGPDLAFCDLDGDGGPDARRPEAVCRAWSSLSAAWADADVPREPAPRGPWMLGISGDQFTLHRPAAKGGLILDASLQGHRPSDHLFLFSQTPLAIEAGAIEGLGQRQSDAGHAAWLTDVSAKHLTTALQRLGEALRRA